MIRRAKGDLLAEVLGPQPGSPTMAEVVVQRLKPLILDGQLPPGTPLRLSEISERLGVSVMPVRDALRLLEAERLVVLAPRRSAVVSELSIEDAEETYAVRVALEALAARRAAERLTDGDVTALQDAFERLATAQRSGDLHAFIAADHEFHACLYMASGRERLIRNISDLIDRSRRYAPYAYRAWQPLDVALAAHRPILDAIVARDAPALERLTSEHMSAAALRLVATIEREAAERARTHLPRGLRGGSGEGTTRSSSEATTTGRDDDR